MSEGGKSGSRKVRKTGSKKSEVGSPKSEEENNSAPDSYRDDMPRSAIKEELPTENSKLPTETMEVHHHPQLHHEKKPWKEYLLEGLMIFLAVTMGFFAESLREHISNKEKTAEYMQSLLVDMKTDTANINEYLTRESKKVAAYNSLLDYLKKPLRHDTAFLSKFYNAAYFIIGRNGMTFTDRIIGQLKNSENFRVINNSKIADAITVYSSGTTYVNYLSGVDDHFAYESQEQARLLINFEVFRTALQTGKPIFDNTIDLIGSDPHAIQQFVNSIYLRIQIENTLTTAIGWQKQEAIALIALLKKEYKLKDE